MDPITLVVAAVALGASAGLTDTASQAVKDAYAGLKDLLSRRKVDVAPVERKPGSVDKQGSLREDLEELEGTAEAVDEVLLAAARRVVAEVKAHDAAAGGAIGIDVDELMAASLRVSGLTSEGTGFKAGKVDVTGDAVFENIRAGRFAAGAPAVGGEERPPQ